MLLCFFLNADNSIGNSDKEHNKNKKNYKIQEIQKFKKTQEIKKNKKKNKINDHCTLEKNSNIQLEKGLSKKTEKEVKEIFEGSTILGDLGDNYGR